MKIPFIDLASQQARLQPGIDQAIKRVLDHGGYIMGPEVAQLEKALASFCGANHALGCANGTVALQLALMALGAGAGRRVGAPLRRARPPARRPVPRVVPADERGRTGSRRRSRRLTTDFL